MSSKFRNHISNNIFTTTFVSEDRKFIYTRPGRTAGTSIVNSLGRGDMEEISRVYYYKKGTNDWLENTTDSEIENDYYKFTFVRNPFERIVSAWRAFHKNTGKVNSNFEIFIRNRGVGHLLYENGEFTNDHWFPQSNYVEYSDGSSFIDYVGKFENLEKDWKTLATKIEVKGTLTKARYSTINYKSFYTTELTKVVSDIYKRDLELFNYEF
jgi:chondroitin 4-sulfotransferase 11